jgi:hypothetical protein
MALGELLLRGTAWLSLLAWAASEWLKGGAGARSRRDGTARALFTGGALALLVHSALAFHFRYGWSHGAAVLDTARQTEAVTGLGFGGGLFVNEVFLLLWSLEAAWWWRHPVRYRSRGRAIAWAVRAFFLMMFVSGAVVFARGPVRLAGVAAIVTVGWAWYRGAGQEVAHG